jgi:hypothetical protein
VRIRSIKPEFWRSDDITIHDLHDRLLFIGLWSYVDDNGVGRDSLALICADLFAADMERDSSETLARVSRGLARLSEAGRIVRYQGTKADGGGENRSLVYITNWDKHQRIDKPAKPRYAPPTREDADSRDTLATPSRQSPEIPAPGAVDQGSSGTVITRKRAKSKTDIPEDWHPHAKHLEKAQALGLNVDLLAESFAEWHAAKGNQFADWDLAFFTWIRNAPQFSGNRPQLRAVVNDGRPEGW